MTVEPVMTRSTLNLEPDLFPFGIPPGSMVEVLGATSTEKSYLVTYLMAKFLASYPDKRAIFIDTRHMFSLDNLVSILSYLVPHLKGIKQESPEEWKNHPGLVPFLERITTVNCYNVEDLLFFFGPKNASQLEKMLLVAPDHAIVFVDALDNFSYCPSFKNPGGTDNPDLTLLLKRSVELTKTPVICVINNYPKPVKPEEPSSSYSIEQEPGDHDPVFANIAFERYYFTHSMFLQRLDEEEKTFFEGERSSGGKSEPKYLIKAYLRSKNNPKMALSAASHCVRFSILSGILNVLRDTD